MIPNLILKVFISLKFLLNGRIRQFLPYNIAHVHGILRSPRVLAFLDKLAKAPILISLVARPWNIIPVELFQIFEVVCGLIPSPTFNIPSDRFTDNSSTSIYKRYHPPARSFSHCQVIIGSILQKNNWLPHILISC